MIIIINDNNYKDQVIQMVRHQIEYYFSPENLDTDIYLRRKMDAQGYIPLSSIASFNRVKSLSQDSELIVAAVKQSTELDMMLTNPTAPTRNNATDLSSILVRPKVNTQSSVIQIRLYYVMIKMTHSFF